jgi:cytochrome P450
MNSLWTTIFTLLQSAFWYVLVPYLLYAKVFLLYRNFYFYANQKDKVVSECTPLPIVAHVPWLLKYWRSKNAHPIDNFVHCTAKDKRFGKCVPVFVDSRAQICIHDVKVVEQLYTTHNRHFDKHPDVQKVTWRLTGRSILFDSSTEGWATRRKTMSPAFYKGKLQGLVQIAKGVVGTYLTRFEGLTAEGPARVNMINEISNLQVSILISCVIGEDISQVKVDFWERGRLV